MKKCEMKLLKAAKQMLKKLNSLTSEQFSRGGEAKERVALEAAVRCADRASKRTR